MKVLIQDNIFKDFLKISKPLKDKALFYIAENPRKIEGQKALLFPEIKGIISPLGQMLGGFALQTLFIKLGLS